MFAGVPIEVRRLGLTTEQVRLYGPPPNFAKETDKLYKAYRRQYGVHCWELDALAPDVIEGLIASELDSLIDQRRWHAAQRQENERQAMLQRIASRWDEVERQFGD